MLLHFVTTNQHKVREVKSVLERYGIELDMVDAEYDESGNTIQEIALNGAKECAERLKVAVIVEDTGIFFDAFDNWPGARPKRVFEELGYDGIFKKLEGKDKGVRFVSAIGYCEPNGSPLLFEGSMRGKLADEIRCPEKDVLPYERIIIPDGFRRTVAELGFEIKNEISHRRQSVENLGRFLRDKTLKDNIKR